MHTSPKEPLQQALLKLKALVTASKQKRVLVIGDIMLDVFISGTTNRMSPEAPVPILKEESRLLQLGGAANTAHNVAALGTHATLIGVVGSDAYGTLLRKMTREKGIRSKLIVENNFITTTKTRAVGPQGHLLRIDTEAILPITPETEEQLISIISKVASYDVVIISDYAKGVLTERVIQVIKNSFKPEQIFVDTKPSRIHLYKNIGLIKVNAQETKEITGITVSSKQNTENALQAIYKLTNSSVVITRGGKGLTAFDMYTNNIHHITPIKTQVKDVVGAGDTTLAILACMSVDNKNLLQSAQAANYVASKVVAKAGTIALTKEELLEAINTHTLCRR